MSIEVHDYHKSYGATVAVAGISFTVAPGEILGLVGPNGAGKTTTLRALAGILTPSRGRLLIDGHDLAREPVAAKAALAFVPDEPHLFESLTVWEHLRFVAAAYRVRRLDRAGRTAPGTVRAGREARRPGLRAVARDAAEGGDLLRLSARPEGGPPRRAADRARSPRHPDDAGLDPPPRPVGHGLHCQLAPPLPGGGPLHATSWSCIAAASWSWAVSARSAARSTPAAGPSRWKSSSSG